MLPPTILRSGHDLSANTAIRSAALPGGPTITQALDFAAHGIGVALVPQSASRFQRPGVLFRPLTELIRIETALFLRNDQVRTSMKDFISVALSGVAALKLNP